MNDKDINNLNEIHRRFSQIVTMYEELSDYVKRRASELHDEEFSLAHCCQFGEYAISDLRNELDL